MDPQACLQRWIYAVARGDAREAREAWEDLRDWLAKGGFEPKWPEGMREQFFSVQYK